jgi:hypothetical protein
MKRLTGKLFLSLLISVLCVPGFGQKASNSKEIVFWVWGLPDSEKDKAEKIVGRRWGIEFRRVAGCTGSKRFFDSLTNHNRNVEHLVQNKYGANWRKRFQASVDSQLANSIPILPAVEH